MRAHVPWPSGTTGMPLPAPNSSGNETYVLCVCISCLSPPYSLKALVRIEASVNLKMVEIR